MITQAIGRAMGLVLTDILQCWEDYALGKSQKCGMSKKAVEHSKIVVEKLFFDISAPSNPTIDSEKHWVLVINNSTDFVWGKKMEL